jgi:predicted DNA-binding transcriptional regulator AlpA
MDKYSTRSAAKELGISLMSLMRYIKAKKIPVPPAVKVGGGIVRAWTKDEIEVVRKLLPKIANGRKTRYQKLREKEKPQARVPAPHKTKEKK